MSSSKIENPHLNGCTVAYYKAISVQAEKAKEIRQQAVGNIQAGMEQYLVVESYNLSSLKLAEAEFEKCLKNLRQLRHALEEEGTNEDGLEHYFRQVIREGIVGGIIFDLTYHALLDLSVQVTTERVL